MSQDGLEFELVVDGLAFPEGPVVMPDGSVIVVELMGGRISRCWNGKRETVAETGGGPNGAALGPDGALYVCNSGALDRDAGGHKAGDQGRIERVDLATGRVERLYEACGGFPLSAPNDLVLDGQGGLWFTDMGKNLARTRDISGLYHCRTDGSGIREVHYGAISYNGVGLSPDGATVYVADTFTARVYAFPSAPADRVRPTLVATVPGNLGLDSLAVTAAGNVCVGTIRQGGLATVTPAGAVSYVAVPSEPYVTNIAFGGDDMRSAYITLSTTGRLVRARWPEPGLKLKF
jgi:gluconolactonase